MPRVEMKIEASGNLSTFSTDHPDVELRILSYRSVENGDIVLMQTQMDDPNQLLNRLEDDPEIEWFEILHTDDEELLFQYLQTPKPLPAEAAGGTRATPQLPLIIKNGWVFSDFITSRETLAEYRENLAEYDIPHEILSITEPQRPDTLLTERQQQFITEAIERGYYENPRQCSVTDLAISFEVNKSTASGILHRAESRIIDEYFSSFDDF